MNTKLLLVTAMLSLSACTSIDEALIEPTMTEQTPQLAGGWHNAALNNEISQAVAFAKQYLNKQDVATTSISKVKQQVVAGMNYSFLLKLADNSEYFMKVYQDLENNYQVTESEKIK